MYTTTLFNQLLQITPKYSFDAFVRQHQANRYVKKLTAWNQFVALFYAQATGKESLREIETGLCLHNQLWYHLGVGSVARSSLSDANNRRDHRIFELLFYEMLDRCLAITPSGHKFSFANPLYSLDSTTISLCLSLFDWAKSSRQKGALKLHTLLNNRTAIPELLVISGGKAADIRMAKGMELNLEKGSIIVFDRAYIDYSWWKELNDQGFFLVSRTKSNQRMDFIGQHEYGVTGPVLKDEYVLVNDYKGLKTYPEKMRHVRYYDKVSDRVFDYLTNNFELGALEIALIYKQRWQVELFFKWVKQNLKIKSFLGTSQNAVLSQIWIAMIYYLVLAYIKFQTKFRSLLELTRMIRETLMTRHHLVDLLSLNTKTLHKLKAREGPQLVLF